MWVFGQPWSRWRTVRLLLVVTWIVTLFFRALSDAAAVVRPLQILTAVVLPVILWPWVRGPYRLYSRCSLPLSAHFSVQEMAESARFFPESYERPLVKLGFEIFGYLKKEPRVQVAFYLHPETVDTAQIGRIESHWGPRYLYIFETQFDDGFILESSNGSSVGLLAPDPNHPVFRFPQLRFPNDLYRIHQELKKRFSSARRPVRGSAEEELKRYIARAEAIHQRLVAADYKMDKAGNRYVYTIWGATRHAWLLTWPVKDFRRMRVEARAMKTAGELGLPIHPKLGRLEDSLRRRH